MKHLLALLISAGFFAVLYVLLRWGKPAEGGDALLILVGSLGTAWVGIVASYFPSVSSTGSK